MTKAINKKRLKDIPEFKGHPLLGPLPLLLKPGGLFKLINGAGKLALNHPSGKCYYKLGNQINVLITKPEDIWQLEIINRDNISREKILPFMERLLGNMMGLKKDENWRLKRAALEDYVLSKEGVKALEEPTLNLLDEFFKSFSSATKSLNLEHFIDIFHTHLTGKTLVAMHNLPEIEEELIKYTSELSDELFYPPLLIRWEMPLFMRKLFYRKRINTLPEIHKHFSDNINRLILLPNEKYIKSEKVLLYKMWEIENKLKGKELPITEALFVDANVFLFLAKGNVSVLILMAIKLLAQHPAIKQKLISELRDKIKDNQLSSEEVNKIDYLDMILLETLRLFPAFPMNPKGVDQPFSFYDVPISSPNEYEAQVAKLKSNGDEGFPLLAGDVVVMSAYMMQRSSKYFDAPDDFIPERFSKENRSKIFRSFSYIPFGVGIQNCPGRIFGFQTAKLFLAKLYLNYEIEIENNDFTLNVGKPGTFQLQNPTLATIKPLIK